MRQNQWNEWKEWVQAHKTCTGGKGGWDARLWGSQSEITLATREKTREMRGRKIDFPRTHTHSLVTVVVQSHVVCICSAYDGANGGQWISEEGEEEEFCSSHPAPSVLHLITSRRIVMESPVLYMFWLLHHSFPLLLSITERRILHYIYRNNGQEWFARSVRGERNIGSGVRNEMLRRVSALWDERRMHCISHPQMNVHLLVRWNRPSIILPDHSSFREKKEGERKEQKMKEKKKAAKKMIPRCIGTKSRRKRGEKRNATRKDGDQREGRFWGKKKGR